MDLLGLMIGAGIAGRIIHKSKKRARERETEEYYNELYEEEERRKNTPCLFLDGLSGNDFKLVAVRAAKQIKRLTVSIDGPIIYGTVQSQSGISKWYFKVDFNDYGHITGRYWLSSENCDSSIPKHYADNVVSFIQNGNSDDYNYDNRGDKSYDDSKNQKFVGFCTHCGNKITTPDSLFCTLCGAKLK